MTTAIEVLALVLMVLALGLVIFMGYDVVSTYIKKHRYDRRFNSEPCDVKDAKHLFCELYKNAAEYEVFESADFEGCYLIHRKFYSMGKGYQFSYRDFINDDFDNPIDDDEEGR